MATLAAPIHERQSNIEDGWGSNLLNMQSSAASLIGWVRKCGEGADQDWGVVYMSGGAGWGQRRVMARLSPSGATLEVGMGVTAAAVANAIVSS
jgi:hypothetical protein